MEELYYHQYFKNTADQNSQLTYLPIIENTDDNWPGLSGNVLEALRHVAVDDTSIYICGSANMVKAINNHLLARGVQEQKISAESA